MQDLRSLLDAYKQRKEREAVEAELLAVRNAEARKKSKAFLVADVIPVFREAETIITDCGVPAEVSAELYGFNLKVTLSFAPLPNTQTFSSESSELTVYHCDISHGIQVIKSVRSLKQGKTFTSTSDVKLEKYNQTRDGLKELVKLFLVEVLDRN